MAAHRQYSSYKSHVRAQEGADYYHPVLGVGAPCPGAARRWGGAGGVLGRRGAVTVSLRCGSCDRASFEVGDGAGGIEFPRSLFPRL